ncbi:putative laccase-9 [Lolium perenne]|uniref:putative laccase-9 n=1 Tax=Lolium perenne TaxID=4522 RepID=UPI0021F664BD|nr:putative laccase-9 [Lolium perenne]
MGVVIWLLAVVLTLGVAAGPAEASKNHHYDFFIKEANYTRLCQEKTILTVNGQFPGPTIFARKGDVMVVNVYNQGNKNITIHWHGVDQPRNPWSDGPMYITQCPIQPGANLTYTVILSEEEGTLWWHAHSDYDRTTIHGAIVIHPKLGTAFPFKKPHKEIPIILSEWWNADVNQLLEESRKTGGEVSISDVNTINGQPGDFFPCSKNGTFKAAVESGKTYLLRIINAGLANDLFFGVAGHRLTVVGTDARYTKPFTVKQILISPGQTVDALLHADRAANGSSNGRYYMAARTLASNTDIGYDNTTATAILEYTDAPPASRAGRPDFPGLPAFNDLNASAAYTAQLRSLGNKAHPVDVPTDVDEHMLITIAINVVPCATGNATCEGPRGNRFAASLNNVSFHLPTLDILDAYYGSVRGVYETDFPDMPPFVFNFTDNNVPVERWFTKRGTKVKVLEYGAVVEVVFQDTAILGAENHPMHLHGFSFYVVGMGLGNFNQTKDPATYNLIDPPFQNTVTVPKSGWAAIRFRAANPGVWFMHCHFERHSEWGMDTVFIVKDGKTPESKMMRRPPGMPRC